MKKVKRQPGDNRPVVVMWRNGALPWFAGEHNGWSSKRSEAKEFPGAKEARKALTRRGYPRRNQGHFAFVYVGRRPSTAHLYYVLSLAESAGLEFLRWRRAAGGYTMSLDAAGQFAVEEIHDLFPYEMAVPCDVAASSSHRLVSSVFLAEIQKAAPGSVRT